MIANRQDVLDALPSRLFIGGDWSDAHSGATFSVSDPATGETLATIADAGADDALAALASAADAQAGWAATAPRERGEILRRAFDLVTERREEFALLMTLEMGKPLAEARGEVTYGAEFLRWFSEEAARISGRYGANPEGTGHMIVSHRPVGPCFLITPWNFPLAMATRKIAPALAAGCTAIIKPAELTPLTTLALAAVFEEAGLPAGVLSVLTTTVPAVVTQALLNDPRLRKLSFTGSTEVGKRLLAQSAAHVLRTSMELGGNAPFLVFEDADLEAAVDGVMIAKFRNIGQACTAANRILVHEAVAAEFTSRVSDRVSALKVGPGTDEGVQIGPLIDVSAVAKATELITDAVDRGASVEVGGAPFGPAGTFLPPTVVTGVAAGSRILDEEIFGPVLAITTFTSEEDAVAKANATEYGLVAYVYTESLARGHRMMDSLEAGMIGLNTGVVSNAAAPFGGVKQSGLGREGGSEGISEYLTTTYTLVPSS
jgi:succinate-semialdehyde dehydrogenase/glutarate-semialdehyde dehydrogenase